MLAIAGGKGGCGKTTTALGLARALATADRRPLVVDADCDMPNVHAVAEAPLEPTTDAVADGAAATALARESRRFPGVAVLGAGDRQSMAGALDRLEWPHGPTLVDCPAGADRTAAAPLRAVDRTLLVTLPTRCSVTDTAKTAAMARTLGAPPLGVVCNRCRDPPPVADALDCPVATTLPAVDGPPLADQSVTEQVARLSTAILRRNI